MYLSYPAEVHWKRPTSTVKNLYSGPSCVRNHPCENWSYQIGFVEACRSTDLDTDHADTVNHPESHHHLVAAVHELLAAVSHDTTGWWWSAQLCCPWCNHNSIVGISNGHFAVHDDQPFSYLYWLVIPVHSEPLAPQRRPKDLNLVANNLRRLEDNGADIREPRSPYLMLLGSGAVDDWWTRSTPGGTGGILDLGMGHQLYGKCWKVVPCL